MNIPPFWARAEFKGKNRRGATETFESIGWSFASLQDARDEAVARAKRIFEVIASGRKPDRYEYSGRPIREEILEEFSEESQPYAVITRNRYGALVLNCSRVMFVDVDLPKPASRRGLPSGGVLESLLVALGFRKKPTVPTAPTPDPAAQFSDWATQNPDRSFRLYRTKAGFRLLFTDREYEPESEDTIALMQGLKSDPLYIRLTKTQKCFRARLTSKPWRCNACTPPGNHPREDARQQAAFRRWEDDYTKKDANFKVCELVSEFGSPAGIPSIQRIVAIHDRGTRIGMEAPLA